MATKATLPPPKRNHSMTEQGAGFSPSTMFGSIERADLKSIERPRRTRLSSIERMMKALRLEEEGVNHSFDSSIGDLPILRVDDAGEEQPHQANMTLSRNSNKNRQDDARRRCNSTKVLATAKTIRISNCTTTMPKANESDNEDSVHESIMTTMTDERRISIKSGTPEESFTYHDSRDSMHELTMEIIRNEQAERSKLPPSAMRPRLKVPSAVFESSKFIEEDGLMVLKRRDGSQRTGFNASSA